MSMSFKSTSNEAEAVKFRDMKFSVKHLIVN